MASTPSSVGELTLGHIFSAAGIDLADVVVLRHTSQPKQKGGLRDVRTATEAEILAYTRQQLHNFISGNPPKLWLVFLEDGSYGGNLYTRFYTAYENAGELEAERAEATRIFDLSPSPVLGELRNRLVIGWKNRGFKRSGNAAANLRVLEIADPNVIAFPGFDNLRLTYRELQQAVHDPHYKQWQAALRAVKAIYLITDTNNGKHYVGKADGPDGLLGRWTAYADNGHGWNKELVSLPKGHCEHFQFSILQVHEPRTLERRVNETESHYKLALMSRSPYGYNTN